MYILDEPSIGLHQRDNQRLLDTLVRLRDLGNTVIVVEHDEEAIRQADHVVDLGPGAGVHGGEIVAQGTARRGRGEPGLDHRAVPQRAAAHRSAAGAHAPTARARDPHRRCERQQPAQRRRRHPDRADDLRHGRVRLGQVDAGQRHAVPARRDCAAGLDRRVRAGRGDRRARADRSRDRHRPEPDRSHAALESGDLHRPVRADPRIVRRSARGARARLRSGAVQLQREGRTLRGLPGRRRHQGRDALPARRLRALRRLPGHALQPRDARDPLQGPQHPRSAGDDGRGRARVLPQRADVCRASCRRCSTSACPTCTSARTRPRCPAARRSASSSRGNWPSARPAARSTSSTSRPPACTSTTSTSCCTCCTGCATRATRSS